MFDPRLSSPDVERVDWMVATDAAHVLFQALVYEGGELGRLLVHPPFNTADAIRRFRDRAARVDDALRAARSEWDRVVQEALRREPSESQVPESDGEESS